MRRGLGGTVRIEFQKFHPKQREIYNGLSARTALRCGRRFGKTALLESTAVRRALNGKLVGWFTPDYKLMRPSYSRTLSLGRPAVMTHSKTDALITFFGGGSIEFWTLDNEDAGRSRKYDLAIVDECSLQRKGMREIMEQAIMPTLLDRRGDAILAGTPKGIDAENYFYQACTDKSLGWKEFHAPTSMNPTLDPLGVANLVNEYAPLVYQQEFLAEFVDWSGEAFFSLDKMLIDGKPVEGLKRCDAIFAVIDSATKTGKENDGTGVVFYALNKVGDGPPLTILDWDIQQISGDLLDTWLTSIFQRLNEFAKTLNSRAGSLGVWIEDKASGMVLIQQSKRRGLMVHAIDSKLTSVGKEERAISISGYIHQGKVKISREAHDKVSVYKDTRKNHLLGQVLGFRIGDDDPRRQDDLLDCFTYGTAIALGDAGGF